MLKPLCLLLLAVSLGTVWAQAPPTLEQGLAGRHIGASRDALLSALQNSDPTVRGIAAMLLASNRDEKAISAIRGAINIEPSELTRFNMARALKLLGDPLGNEVLTKLCSDEAFRSDWRLEAAGELAPDVGKACFRSVVDILASSNNPVLTGASLQTLLKLNKSVAVSHPESDVLAQGLISALSNSISDVRQQAAECIAGYKVTAATSALQNAAGREADPATQAVLRKALRQLTL